MSSPSDTQPPVGTAQPSTQEIPVVQPAAPTQQLPPHPDAVSHAAVPMEAPQPTGPVEFMPGLPGSGTPPVPPPPPVQPAAAAPAPTWPDTLESDEAPGKERRLRRPRDREPGVRTPRDRAALISLALAALSLVLLELGLTLAFDRESYWSVVTLWSAFATFCGVVAVLALAASLPAASRVKSGMVWRIAAGALVGLAVFWLLVVLPVVAGDRGFLLTAALGALGAALWIGPGRRG